MNSNSIYNNSRFLRALRSGLGKTAVIYPAAFLVSLAIGTTILGMIFYADDVFNAPPRHIGFLSATWSLAYIFGCFALRPLVSKMLPRNSVLLATSLLPFFLFLMLKTETFSWLFPLYALFGFSISLFWPPLIGWLSLNLEGRHLGRAMGRFNLCWSVGGIISPALAGRLAEVSAKLPLQVAVILLLATASLILGAAIVLQRISAEDNAFVEHREKAEISDTGTLLRFPSWLGIFAAFIGGGVMLTVLPLAGPRELQLSKGMVGILLLVRAFANTSGHFFMGRTEFWHFRFRPIPTSIFSLAFILIVLSFSRHPLVLGATLFLSGIFTATSYAISLFHGIAGSKDRAGRMAIHEALLSGGMFCGASLGGLLYDMFGFTWVFLVTAILLCGIGFGQILLMKSLQSENK